jgi:DNA modification methylase
MGSGTTAIACINTNRNYIGFEMDKHYCEIANERIQKALAEKAVGEYGNLFDLEKVFEQEAE